VRRMMSVLIAYASARPSTTEIAEQIADRLVKSGFAVVVRPAEQVESIESYRLVVLGSDAYNRKRLLEASNFLSRFAEELARISLLMFSTGRDAETSSFGRQFAALVDDKPGERASDSTHLLAHRHFAGTFERRDWSLLRDLFFKVCGRTPGDLRDWRDVNAWAADIARELQRVDHLKERRRLHLSVRGRP